MAKASLNPPLHAQLWAYALMRGARDLRFSTDRRAPTPGTRRCAQLWTNGQPLSRTGMIRYLYASSASASTAGFPLSSAGFVDVVNDS